MLEGMSKPISKQELERRWKATRKAMEKAKLDCLIMQSHFKIKLCHYQLILIDKKESFSYFLIEFF
jgi:hypothetical protein